MQIFSYFQTEEGCIQDGRDSSIDAGQRQRPTHLYLLEKEYNTPVTLVKAHYVSSEGKVGKRGVGMCEVDSISDSSLRSLANPSRSDGAASMPEKSYSPSVKPEVDEAADEKENCEEDVEKARGFGVLPLSSMLMSSSSPATLSPPTLDALLPRRCCKNSEMDVSKPPADKKSDCAPLKIPVPD